MQKKQTATSGSQKKIDKYFLLKLRKKTQIKKKKLKTNLTLTTQPHQKKIRF